MYGVRFADDGRRDAHRQRLTVTPAPPPMQTGGDDAAPEPIELYIRDAHDPRLLWVPCAYGYQTFGPAPFGGDVLEPDRIDAPFRGTLATATKQRDVFRSIVARHRESGAAGNGCVAVLPCGFGKTVLALACVAELRWRTLVVVPNTILLDQWAERAATFTPGASVRIVQGALRNQRARAWSIEAPAQTVLQTPRVRTIRYHGVEATHKVRVRALRLLRVETDTRGATVERWGELGFTVRRAAEAEAAVGTVVVRVTEEVKPDFEWSEEGGRTWVWFPKPRSLSAHRLGSLDATPAPMMPRAAVPPHLAALEPAVDIAATTVHTLAAGAFGTRAAAAFGLVVADEVHSMCTRTFLDMFTRIPARFTLALTATPERRDGTHSAYPLTIGPTVARVARSYDCVAVHRVPFVGVSTREIRLWNGELNLAAMITALGQDAERDAVVATIVRRLYDSGRTILCLGDRVDHLKALCDRFRADDAGVMVGSTPAAERRAISARRLVFATYPLVKQGYDKPELDTLVMVTPITALEQPVGRILRTHPAKRSPLVVDIEDQCSIFLGEGRKRKRFYDANGYQCTAYASTMQADEVARRIAQ